MKMKSNPGAVNEFRHQHDDDGDAGDESAKPVDRRFLKPMLPAMLPPVHHHARLRKREGQKSADGIERDQPIGDAAKKNEKAAGQYRQHNDAVCVDEPPPAVTEDMREVVVLCDGAAEARENRRKRCWRKAKERKERSPWSGSRKSPCRKRRR